MHSSSLWLRPAAYEWLKIWSRISLIGRIEVEHLHLSAIPSYWSTSSSPPANPQNHPLTICPCTLSFQNLIDNGVLWIGEQTEHIQCGGMYLWLFRVSMIPLWRGVHEQIRQGRYIKESRSAFPPQLRNGWKVLLVPGPQYVLPQSFRLPEFFNKCSPCSRPEFGYPIEARGKR
jgi:hypothetical protein